MEITKCLTISTAHITEETNEKLKEAAIGTYYNIGLSVYEKSIYGYWIYVPRICESESIPNDLFKCLELAKENDCEWLCLDCDGEEVPELPTYDW